MPPTLLVFQHILPPLGAIHATSWTDRERLTVHFVQLREFRNTGDNQCCSTSLHRLCGMNCAVILKGSYRSLEFIVSHTWLLKKISCTLLLVHWMSLQKVLQTLNIRGIYWIEIPALLHVGCESPRLVHLSERTCGKMRVTRIKSNLLVHFSKTILLVAAVMTQTLTCAGEYDLFPNFSIQFLKVAENRRRCFKSLPVIRNVFEIRVRVFRHNVVLKRLNHFEYLA